MAAKPRKPRPMYYNGQRENLSYPQGSYTSIKPGPSYGLDYVAPPEEQFVDMRQPVPVAAVPQGKVVGALQQLSPEDLPGRPVLEEVGAQIGNGATAVGSAVGSAAKSVGGFFSNMFGGGDEEEAKETAKNKLKDKLNARRK